MKVTSVQTQTRGAHDHVRIWVDGKLVGTLITDAGKAAELLQALRHAWSEIASTWGA